MDDMDDMDVQRKKKKYMYLQTSFLWSGDPSAPP